MKSARGGAANRRKLPRLDPLGPPGRQHRGDIMSKETRSALMSRIRGKNTGPERIVADMLLSLGHLPELHAKDLAGCPDFVFRDLKVAIFVDGDFWHGWRFPSWRLKLSEKWELKIEATRRRDRRNHARLRRAGWKVLRVWEHQVHATPETVRSRIDALVASRSHKDDPRVN